MRIVVLSTLLLLLGVAMIAVYQGRVTQTLHALATGGGT